MMRGAGTVLVVVFIVAAIGALTWTPALFGAAPSAPAVLILYDSASEAELSGAEYAVMLENLLGHFQATVVKKPVTAYVAGDLARYDTTFYVGAVYDEPLFYADRSPERARYNAFLRDAANPPKPLVWINYNIWHLAWRWNPAWGAPTFEARFGLAFWGIDDWSMFNRVVYKNTELLKGVVPYVVTPVAPQTARMAHQTTPPRGTPQRRPRRIRDSEMRSPRQADLPATCIPEGNGMYDCVPALAVMAVVTDRARVHAEAFSTFTSTRYPYVTQSGDRRLWYVDDMPFSYLSEEDRYLAFADLLHEMLGIPHAELHRALVRLEDVSAADDPQDLRQAIAVLAVRRIPFGVGTIPYYADPLGFYGGSPQAIPLSISEVAAVLRLAVSRQRASIVQHGTTHQYDSMVNPYTGASGDDAEFFRVVENPNRSLTYVGPVAEDSEAWARGRTLDGQVELNRAGLTPFAWEAPHYAASQADYRAVRGIYKVQWGRLMYAGAGAPPERFVWQFFPYVVERDVHGFRIIPESLGHIDPEPLPGYPAFLPDDLIRRAMKQLVVRDGVVGFFYHPYLGPLYLTETVDGIRHLGYKFVTPLGP